MERDLESLRPDVALPTVAAVDLGSNSFHMIVVRGSGANYVVLDRLKEPVRLAAGMNETRHLDEAACTRALACLSRFAQRLGKLDRNHVRVVGTNALRRARDAEAFIEQASAVLGHPIEIIYGVEEARLIYGGAVQDLGDERPRRLVVDIGGGSTELIIGDGALPRLMKSVSLGAVVHTQRFFPGGRITPAAWRAAVLDARLALEPIARAYREAGWDQVIGTSGSIRSILHASANRMPVREITPAALAALGKAVVKAGRTEAIDLSGVSGDRQPIFAGGLALLTGLFESLGIETMSVSDKALREGLVAELLGRLEDQDVREAAVARAGECYGVDRAQAERVAATALRLLEARQSREDSALAMRFLRWAALLHEIGLAISHRGYHKHGEYILRNADLPGFSKTDQVVLATLVRLHRGPFRDKRILALPRDWQTLARQLALALRLAVILHRDRDPEVNRPPTRLAFGADGLALACDARWLAERPLTQADLEREADVLGREGINLRVSHH